jgi:hypothetical protein
MAVMESRIASFDEERDPVAAEFSCAELTPSELNVWSTVEGSEMGASKAMSLQR